MSYEIMRSWGMFLTTIIFLLVWYMWWYPYTNMLLDRYTQQIKIIQKKIDTIRALENTCSNLSCTTTTLEADVMRCIATHKEQCDTDTILASMLKQMTTHNIHIKECSLHNNIKNDTSFNTCSATFSLEGSISNFLEFLNNTRQLSHTIIPIDVVITQNNTTTINYTCAWIRYT